MGCFNTVIINCSCGHVNEFQSKAGSSDMSVFQAYQAPLEDLASVFEDGTVDCESCGQTFTFRPTIH